MFNSPKAENRRDFPLIVQSDYSILLDLHGSRAEEAREVLYSFAHLEKSPEHIHTYRITPLSLWNACSEDLDAAYVLRHLRDFSRFPLPPNLEIFITETMGRYGLLELHPNGEDGRAEHFLLRVKDKELFRELKLIKRLKKWLFPINEGGEDGFVFSPLHRGTVKAELIKMNYPVTDLIPLKEGDPLPVSRRSVDLNRQPFSLRPYQKQAVDSFWKNKECGSGFGTIILPCGSGKTLVGIGVLERAQTHTLILSPNANAVKQWIRELLNRTTLTPDEIGEYTGEKKEIKPVTVTTYQILTWRKTKEDEFLHFKIFREKNWGLIIYDEVHLLPAQIFRTTAELQAVRRLGLTATLVREDRQEDMIFSLIGPCRFNMFWKELEKEGWIAKAFCHEIRIPLPRDRRLEYATSQKRARFRIAAENPDKQACVHELLEKHKNDSVLVIGQYLDQLKQLAEQLPYPLITGRLPSRKREELYDRFRQGEVKVLLVSGVANFAIDLPDASVGIQISGTFGSRQEEAQRLGRILRPKEKPAYFYSLISQNTSEEEYSMKRQQFLTEQGYAYDLIIWDRSKEEAAP